MTQFCCVRLSKRHSQSGRAVNGLFVCMWPTCQALPLVCGVSALALSSQPEDCHIHSADQNTRPEASPIPLTDRNREGEKWSNWTLSFTPQTTPLYRNVFKCNYVSIYIYSGFQPSVLCPDFLVSTLNFNFGTIATIKCILSCFISLDESLCSLTWIKKISEALSKHFLVHFSVKNRTRTQ